MIRTGGREGGTEQLDALFVCQQLLFGAESGDASRRSVVSRPLLQQLNRGIYYLSMTCYITEAS
jgi:hypothetical protein